LYNAAEAIGALLKTNVRTNVGRVQAMGLLGKGRRTGFHVAIRRLGVDIVRYPLERSLESLLKRILTKYKISHVLDIGANVGEWGSMLRRFGYDGYIYSFEATPETFARLAQKTEGDKKWHSYNIALGDCDAQLRLRCYKADDLNSFLGASALGKKILGDELSLNLERVIRVRPLDVVLSELLGDWHRHRIFVKTDTQGFDLNVLRGARETLRSAVGLQIEVPFQSIYEGMPAWQDLLGFAYEEGFTVSDFFPITVDKSLAAIEMDCVLIRASFA
jgi:FkbM family methyltransferase